MVQTARTGARALNKPALLLGISPGLAGMAFMLAGLVAGLSESIVGRVSAALLFVAVWTAGRRISKTDPELLFILRKWFQTKSLYDPMKVDPRG